MPSHHSSHTKLPEEVTIFNIFIHDAAMLEVGKDNQIKLMGSDFTKDQRALMQQANTHLEHDLEVVARSAFLTLAAFCTSEKEAANLACFLVVAAGAIATANIPQEKRPQAFRHTVIADLKFALEPYEPNPGEPAVQGTIQKALDQLTIDYCAPNYLNMDNALTSTEIQGPAIDPNTATEQSKVILDSKVSHRKIRDTARTAFRNTILLEHKTAGHKDGKHTSQDRHSVHFISDAALAKEFAETPAWQDIILTTPSLLNRLVQKKSEALRAVVMADLMEAVQALAPQQEDPKKPRFSIQAAVEHIITKHLNKLDADATSVDSELKKEAENALSAAILDEHFIPADTWEPLFEGQELKWREIIAATPALLTRLLERKPSAVEEFMLTGLIDALTEVKQKKQAFSIQTASEQVARILLQLEDSVTIEANETLAEAATEIQTAILRHDLISRASLARAFEENNDEKNFLLCALICATPALIQKLLSDTNFQKTFIHALGNKLEDMFRINPRISSLIPEAVDTLIRISYARNLLSDPRYNKALKLSRSAILDNPDFISPAILGEKFLASAAWRTGILQDRALVTRLINAESLFAGVSLTAERKKTILDKYHAICPVLNQTREQRLTLFKLLIALYGENAEFTRNFFNQASGNEELQSLSNILSTLSAEHRTQLYTGTNLLSDLIPLREKLQELEAEAEQERPLNNMVSLLDDEPQAPVTQESPLDALQNLLNINRDQLTKLTKEQLATILAIFPTTLPASKKQAIAQSLAGIFNDPNNAERYNAAYAAAHNYGPTLHYIFSLLTNHIAKLLAVRNIDQLLVFLSKLDTKLIDFIFKKSTNIEASLDRLMSLPRWVAQYGALLLDKLPLVLKKNLFKVYIDPFISLSEKQSITQTINQLDQAEEDDYPKILGDAYTEALKNHRSGTQKALALFLRDRISRPENITSLIYTTPAHLLIQVLSHSELKLDRAQITQLLAKLGEVNANDDDDDRQPTNDQLNWPGNLLRALRDRLKTEHHVGTLNFDFIEFAMAYYLEQADCNTPPTAEAFEKSSGYSRKQKSEYAACQSDGERIEFFHKLRNRWIRNLTREERKIALAVIDRDNEAALRAEQSKPVELSREEMLKAIYENNGNTPAAQAKMVELKAQKAAAAVTALKHDRLQMRALVKAHDWFFDGSNELIDAMPDTPFPTELLRLGKDDVAKLDTDITKVLRLLQARLLKPLNPEALKAQDVADLTTLTTAENAVKATNPHRENILKTVTAVLALAKERSAYLPDEDTESALKSLRAIKKQLDSTSFRNLTTDQRPGALKKLLANPTDSYSGLSATDAIKALKEALSSSFQSRDKFIREKLHARARALLFVRDTNPKAYRLWLLHDEAELNLLQSTPENKDAQTIRTILLAYCQTLYSMRKFDVDWTNNNRFNEQQTVLEKLRDTANLFAQGDDYRVICASLKPLLAAFSAMNAPVPVPAATACQNNLIAALAAMSNDNLQPLKEAFAPSSDLTQIADQEALWQEGGQYALPEWSWARIRVQLSRLNPLNYSSAARASIQAQLDQRVFTAQKISAIVAAQPSYAAKALASAPYREILAADPAALFEVISLGLAEDNSELRDDIISRLLPTQPLLHPVISAYLNTLEINEPVAYQQFALRHFDCIQHVNPKNTLLSPSSEDIFFTALKALVDDGKSKEIMHQVRKDAGLQKRLTKDVFNALNGQAHEAHVLALFDLLIKTDDLADVNGGENNPLSQLCGKLDAIAAEAVYKRSLALLYPEWYTKLTKEDPARPEKAKQIFFNHLVALLTTHNPQELTDNQAAILKFKDHALFKANLESALADSEKKAHLSFLMPDLIPEGTEKQTILLQGTNYGIHQLKNIFVEMLSESSSFGDKRRTAFNSWLDTAEATDLNAAIALIGAAVNNGQHSNLSSENLPVIIRSIRDVMPARAQRNQAISVRAELTMRCLAILSTDGQSKAKESLALKLLSFCQKAAPLTPKEKEELVVLKISIERLSDFTTGTRADRSLLSFNSTTMDSLIAEFDLTSEDPITATSENQVKKANTKVLALTEQESAQQKSTTISIYKKAVATGNNNSPTRLANTFEHRAAKSLLNQLTLIFAEEEPGFVQNDPVASWLSDLIDLYENYHAKNQDTISCGSESLKEREEQTGYPPPNTFVPL